MSSKRSHEAYFSMDHTDSPGLTDAEVARADLPAGSGQGLFESAAIVCSHCQAVVVLNPKRTRERGYCKKCDHYLCDICTTALQTTGICKPFKEVIYEYLLQVDKGLNTADTGLIITGRQAL